MTDIVVERLRIRGPQGRRLAGIAARWLPDALSDSCADLADTRLGRLVVSLDFDPRDYDDETLAVLWADRIRKAAIAAGASARTAGPPAPGPGPASPTESRSAAPGDRPAPDLPRPLSVPDVLVIVLRWIEVGRIPATAEDAAAMAALADGVLARGAIAHLTTGQLKALHDILADPDSPSAAVRPPRPGPAEDAAGAQGAPSERADGAGGAPPSRDGPHAARPGAAALADRIIRIARDRAGHAGLESGTPANGPDDGARAITAVAGLALLYPWLTTYCEGAAAAHPDVDPVAIRRVALAHLAGLPGPTVVDDPLVLFLAGADPRTGAGDGAAAALAAAATAVARRPSADDLRAAADAVLASFAALVRGFERSTPDFVRREWIARTGHLVLSERPARLDAERRALDIALGTLPYPLGPFALPWTGPLAVRLRP